jgi:hypothetical protein
MLRGLLRPELTSSSTTSAGIHPVLTGLRSPLTRVVRAPEYTPLLAGAGPAAGGGSPTLLRHKVGSRDAEIPRTSPGASTLSTRDANADANWGRYQSDLDGPTVSIVFRRRLWTVPVRLRTLSGHAVSGQPATGVRIGWARPGLTDTNGVRTPPNAHHYAVLDRGQSACRDKGRVHPGG